MKPVLVGTLGNSHHFLTRVLPGLKKSNIVRMCAIASRDAGKSAETARIHRIPKFYASYEELLGDNDIELVYIPLPNNLHAEWIKKCADHGKHVICEKPLAMNAAEAKDAIAYADKKGVRVMEAFMYRFHPQWERVKEIVSRGKIGKVRSIHTFFGYDNPNPDDIRNKRETGGGALYDIGCYAISTARFITGGEPTRAICVIENDPVFKTDILTHGMLDFGDARALFTVSTRIEHCQRVEIFGTGGSITVTLPFNARPHKTETVIVLTGGREKKERLGPADQYRTEFEQFAIALRKGTPVPTPPDDAIANMKVIDALFKSAKSGAWEKTGI